MVICYCCYSQHCAPLSSPPSLFAFHIEYAYFPIGILVSFCGQEMGLTTLSELTWDLSVFFFFQPRMPSYIEDMYMLLCVSCKKTKYFSVCVVCTYTWDRTFRCHPSFYDISRKNKTNLRALEYSYLTRRVCTLPSVRHFVLCSFLLFFHISFQASAMPEFILNRLRIKLMVDLTPLVLARI